MILIILLMLFITHPCFSQTEREDACADALQVAIEYYDSKAYIKSINELESIINDCDEDYRVHANTYLAFNYVAIGDEATAIKHFKKALSLNPDLELVEHAVSSDIQRVFEEATRELAHESGGCSCFIPGIGQFMKGEENKGRVIIAASGVTLTTAIITWAVADSKHNHYLALGPEDIDDMDVAYDDYNRWRKASIVAATTFAGIYLYSIFDAILSRKPINNATTEEDAGLNIDSDGETLSISYKIGL